MKINYVGRPVIAGSDVQVVITQEQFYGKMNVVAMDLAVPNSKARFALACIERWGVVAGEPDGEDSAGRQQLRMLAPEKVVKRAFRIAELAFAEAKERGWLSKLPTIGEVDEILSRAQSEEDAKGKEIPHAK